MSAADLENETLAQSFRHGEKRSKVAASTVEEAQAIDQSFGGRALKGQPPSGCKGGHGLTSAEMKAIEESFGSRAPGQRSLAGHERPTASPSQARQSVSAAVLRAVELSKGDKRTAAFMLQSYAAADTSLHDTLLAGNDGDARRSISEAAEKEVAAFLGASAGPSEQ